LVELFLQRGLQEFDLIVGGEKLECLSESLGYTCRAEKEKKKKCVKKMSGKLCLKSTYASCPGLSRRDLSLQEDLRDVCIEL
jgi:hypothetical protein